MDEDILSCWPEDGYVSVEIPRWDVESMNARLAGLMGVQQEVSIRGKEKPSAVSYSGA